MFYTGIGSRYCPQHVLNLITTIASQLELDGYTLRTGAARGCDTAFARGVKSTTNRLIYNPPNRFIRPNPNIIDCSQLPNWQQAIDISSRYHPKWKSLSHSAKMLMSRSVYQILGTTLDDPSEFVLCYTSDGSEGDTSKQTGGTGQAIRIAVDFNIPVINVLNYLL